MLDHCDAKEDNRAVRGILFLGFVNSTFVKVTQLSINFVMTAAESPLDLWYLTSC